MQFFTPTSTFDQELTIDSGCGHAILNVMSFLTKSGGLDYSDILHFANNLVYDERIDVCYAFDPRDESKRRLQEFDEE